jgi:hypothetical protein
MQRIRAAIGDRYRIYDEATGKTPPDIVVKRLDSHMIIEGLPDGAQVELTDFYARCGVSSPCTLVIDSDAIFSSGPVEISPASPPLQALTDGSFVLYPSNYSGTPAIAVADGTGFPRAAAYAVGGLAIVALAGAGGGGGDSEPSSAVSPNPPAAAPPPGAIDTTPPDQPAITSEKVSDTRTPVISGTAESGATVKIDIDTDRDGRIEASFTTVADANGQWQVDLARTPPRSGSLPAAGLPEASPSLITVMAIDGSQNQSSATQFELMVDATAPGAPRITAIVDDAPAGVGVVPDNGRTNDRSPTIQGRLDEPLADGERLELLRNGEVINASVAVDGTGWSVTDSGLAFGNTYDYTARVVDGVGHSSTSNEYRIVVQSGTDTVASVTAVTDNAAPRTGNVADGGATNDSTPTISGTLSAPLVGGESIQVLRNGAAIAASVIVDGDNWRLTDARLPDGSYTYTARVVDAEGAGSVSAGYRITVDTENGKSASITGIIDNAAPGIGTVRDGGVTNDSSPTLNGGLSAALAAGEELQVLRNDAVISTSPTIAGTSWAFTDAGLGNGNYDYTVRIVDAAGNVGRESANFDLRVSLSRENDDDDDDDDADADDAALALGDLLDAGDPVAFADASPGPTSNGVSTVAMMPGNSLDELLAT